MSPPAAAPPLDTAGVLLVEGSDAAAAVMLGVKPRLPLMEGIFIWGVAAVAAEVPWVVFFLDSACWSTVNLMASAAALSSKRGRTRSENPVCGSFCHVLVYRLAETPARPMVHVPNHPWMSLPQCPDVNTHLVRR